MKQLLFLTLTILVFTACRQEKITDQGTTAIEHALTVLTDEQPEWQYENLRLFPIVADETFIRENAAAGELKTLEEAIQSYGFRISEKKPYGRFEDQTAVNSLTVQNKTAAPVFLMSGDIVQGGRQDRVVGDDQVIAARSLQDIPVFCVERGRWNYHDTSDEDAASKAKNDKVFAFSGYYHVAAGDIRQTLAGSKNQQEVWDNVSRLTTHHATESQTGAYASLEESETFTHSRDNYLRFFAGKFSEINNLVGVIAISGNKVIGTDIFGNPDLFRRQITPLLHSYATDAITKGSAVHLDEAILQRQIKKVRENISDTPWLRYQGALVHYYQEATAIE